MSLTINKTIAEKLKLKSMKISKLKELITEHFGVNSDRSCMIYDAAIDVLCQKLSPAEFIKFTDQLHASGNINVYTISDFFRG